MSTPAVLESLRNLEAACVPSNKMMYAILGLGASYPPAIRLGSLLCFTEASTRFPFCCKELSTKQADSDHSNDKLRTCEDASAHLASQHAPGHIARQDCPIFMMFTQRAAVTVSAHACLVNVPAANCNNQKPCGSTAKISAGLQNEAMGRAPDRGYARIVGEQHHLSCVAS